VGAGAKAKRRNCNCDHDEVFHYLISPLSEPVGWRGMMDVAQGKTTLFYREK
jgi:hypothetical protein